MITHIQQEMYVILSLIDCNRIRSSILDYLYHNVIGWGIETTRLFHAFNNKLQCILTTVIILIHLLPLFPHHFQTKGLIMGVVIFIVHLCNHLWTLFLIILRYDLSLESLPLCHPTHFLDKDFLQSCLSHPLLNSIRVIL